MRETTIDLEMATDYCKAILAAETEEELGEIRGDIVNYLKGIGYEDEYIQNYLGRMDVAVSLIEDGEYVISRDGNLVRNHEATTEIQETPVPSEVNKIPDSHSMASVGLGVTLAALVSTIALKKRVFKNEKTKNR